MFQWVGSIIEPCPYLLNDQIRLRVGKQSTDANIARRAENDGGGEEVEGRKKEEGKEIQNGLSSSLNTAPAGV